MMTTIKEDLKVVKGYESISKIIEVMSDDRHCNSCVIGKSKMSVIPKGKTVSLKPIRKDLKLFVDLSGHIEEPSIWHNFHYTSHLSLYTTGVFLHPRIEIQVPSSVDVNSDICRMW